MYILTMIGILLIWLVYNLIHACIKPTPVIEDKNQLLNSLCGKSKSECNKILRQFKVRNLSEKELTITFMD